MFWVLAATGGLMVITAVFFVPESLPPERRQGGGLRRSLAGVGEVLRVRNFVGYTIVQSFASFMMMAYITDASYVLQGMKGMAPLTYSYFFASTAAAQIVVSLIAAKLVGRLTPWALLAMGVAAGAMVVAALTIGAVALGTPLVLTCAGFLVVMASMGVIYGNSGALGASRDGCVDRLPAGSALPDRCLVLADTEVTGSSRLWGGVCAVGQVRRFVCGGLTVRVFRSTIRHFLRRFAG